MRKQYQITKAKASEQFRNWAAGNKTPIQLTFATAEIAELAQASLGDLLRHVGRVFIETVMEADVEQLVGPRSSRGPHRTAYRWGVEQGFCIIDGQ